MRHAPLPLAPIPLARPAHPRDLGPATPAERTIIARILIRHGYPPPKAPEPLGPRVSAW